MEMIDDVAGVVVVGILIQSSPRNGIVFHLQLIVFVEIWREHVRSEYSKACQSEYGNRGDGSYSAQRSHISTKSWQRGESGICLQDLFKMVKECCSAVKE